MILVGALVVALHLWATHDHEVEHARLLTSSMTEAVALQIDGSFRGINGLLEDVAAVERAGQWSDPAVRLRLRGRMQSYPEIRWVGVVTSSGILLPDTEPSIGAPPEGLAVADRDYVRNAVCTGSPKIRVGQPVVGRATGERTVHLSLPITTSANGDCKGLVVAAVNPDHFADILKSVMLDPAGGTAVINLDGRIVARAPEHATKYGMDLSNSNLFVNFLSKERKGVAHLVSKADGNEKLLGFKVLEPYGLVVTSGLSLSKALANWYVLAIIESLGFLILSVGGFVGARALDLRRQTMLRHQAGLEAAVAERTALLAAAKSLAEDRAERLARVNEKLAHLARITAHHLQEPVRPIVSFSQLARREIVKHESLTELEGHLRFVEEAGRQLKSILREFHRYTALLVREPRLSHCDLGLVTKRSLAHLSDAIAESGATVEAGPLPKVQADGALIEQVLTELIGNAVKYRHPDRPVRVQISGGAETDGGWWLTVIDNGRGLPEVGRQHLFEAFARLNPDDPSSAGLGLAVCLEVVEMHGGIIVAESLELGSQFTIRIPAGNPAGMAA